MRTAVAAAAVLIGGAAGYFLSGRREAPRPDVADSGSRPLCLALGPDDGLWLGHERGVAPAKGTVRVPDGLECSSPVTAVATDEQGAVYAAHGGLVEKFSPEGESLVVWGRGGCDGDPFLTVTGLAASDGSVFVADAGAKLVYRFDPEGYPLGEIGSGETDADGHGFEIPSPFFDCDTGRGVLYVTNPGRHRVETFKFDGERLGHWGEFGNEAHQFPGCCNPTNIAVANDGRIVVSQKGTPVVKVFSPAGKCLAVLGEGEFAAGAKGIDLAVTRDGRLFALDPVSGTVHTFVLGNSPEGVAR